MDIRGLVLLNTPPEKLKDRLRLPGLLALYDVAGQSPLARISDRLLSHGVNSVTAVVEETPTGWPSRGTLPTMDFRPAPSERFWRVAESAFSELVQAGAELVVLARLGAYAEIDFRQLIRFHLQQQCRVSRVECGSDALEIFCISASRRNDAASLFRSRLVRCRADCPPFAHVGYWNPLSDACDLRQLAVDILTLRTEATPAGIQCRPGVWLGSGAVVEKGSRIVAPAFLGSRARIRAGAVVTRCSCIEHHAQVDCGTVVENSTVLPYACIGSGLDLAHSVAGRGMIANLRREAIVKVADHKLIGDGAAGLAHDLVNTAVAALSSLLGSLGRGFSAKVPAPQPALSHEFEQSSPALGNAARYPETSCEAKARSDFASGLAVARKYGDQ